jgi:hypothetical protein
VQVFSDAGLTALEQEGDVIKPPFTTNTLPFGMYYWRVASKDVLGSQGVYSGAFSFEVTLNKMPKKNAILKNGVVKFGWQGVKGMTYLLRINDVTAGTVYYESPAPQTSATYKVDKNAPLPAGNYSWQVSIDGGATWTLPWGFTVN